MALGSMTLAQIRLQAQQRADMENSNFLSTTEWNTNINQSLYALYDLLIEAYGSDFYVASPFSITTDGTNYLYSLPSDFYKLLGVDLNVNQAKMPWISLKPFNFAERNLFQIPDSGRQLQLWYAPRMTELVNDTDTADGVDGWLEYVINDAAAKALAKEESDVSVVVAGRNEIIQRIQDGATARDAGFPATVSDSYALGYNSFYAPNMSYRLTGSKIWLGQFQYIYGGVPGAY